MIEYTLLAAFISLVDTVFITNVGDRVNQWYQGYGATIATIPADPSGESGRVMSISGASQGRVSRIRSLAIRGDEAGQDVIEYGFLSSGIALVGVLLWQNVPSASAFSTYTGWDTGVQSLWAPDDPVTP